MANISRHQLSDIQIQALICPQRVRWPQTGSIPARKLQEAVDALHSLIRGVDTACLAAAATLTKETRSVGGSRPGPR